MTQCHHINWFVTCMQYHIVQNLFGCLGCFYVAYWLGLKQAEHRYQASIILNLLQFDMIILKKLYNYSNNQKNSFSASIF